jgi:thioredoxin reductase (NADPH)
MGGPHLGKPAVLLVDDDTEVLRAVGRDVRRRFGSVYRVLQAGSGEEALEALRQLRLRGEPAALLLADQRMPRMSGVEFLEQARPLFPDAKRALLTAYADTEAAIRAINSAHIHYYLQKPWDPPEEKLYPILDEMLEEWWAGYRPPFEGVRIFGHRWSPEAHRLKDFLARNLVPYQWLDVESMPEAGRLLEQTGLAGAALPLVLFPNGNHLAAATVPDVADRVGLNTRAQQRFYPLVIVGGGPAGLAAAVYAASEGVGTLLVEQDAPGGQAGQSSRIENYLGFPAGISGGELARRAAAQARKFGAEILSPQRVCGIHVDGPIRRLQLEGGSEVACHALLIATGVSYTRLPVPGADALAGAGIYYGAAAAEARECAQEDVYVVGAGNSAGQAALHFAQHARRVTMLVRGGGLAATMSQYLIDQIAATPNIVVRTRIEIAEAQGSQHLEGVVLRDRATGQTEEVPASRVFIFIGAQPHTDWLESVVARDSHGFLLTGTDLAGGGARPKGWLPDRDPFLLETSVPGIFAAGDVRHGSMKRVASGVGEGAMAVSFVHQYLAGL